MATKPVSNEAATAASVEDLATTEVASHDRATTPVSAGRIRFKGHNAAGGYPFRIWEGQVQALVNGDWVEAVDSVPLGTE